MTTALRIWLSAVGLSGLAAVVLGAYGAHAMKGLDAALVARFDTALRYHFIHTLSLALAVVLAMWGDTAALRASRWVFAGGLVLFCGSLYLSALTSGTGSTRLAPVGGVLLMLGWLSLVIHAWLVPGTD